MNIAKREVFIMYAHIPLPADGSELSNMAIRKVSIWRKLWEPE